MGCGTTSYDYPLLTIADGVLTTRRSFLPVGGSERIDSGRSDPRQTARSLLRPLAPLGDVDPELLAQPGHRPAPEGHRLRPRRRGRGSSPSSRPTTPLPCERPSRTPAFGPGRRPEPPEAPGTRRPARSAGRADRRMPGVCVNREAGSMATSAPTGDRTPRAAVSVRGLRKSYGEVEAVAGLDLEIARGEVFALLGPNGAGKTTTVEILEGYRRRTAGDVQVLGVDPEAGGRDLRERDRDRAPGERRGPRASPCARRSSSAAPPIRPRCRPTTSPSSSVSRRAATTRPDALRRTAAPARSRARGRRRPGAAVPRRAHDRLRPIRPAPLVVARRRPPLARKTVLLTTHYMDEAQSLADRVAVMARGRIVAEGPPAMLAGRAHGAALVRFRLPASVGGRRFTLPLPTDIEPEIVDGIVSFRTARPRARSRRSFSGQPNGARSSTRSPSPAPRSRTSISSSPRGLDESIVGRTPPRALARGTASAHRADAARDVLHLRLPVDPPAAARLARRRGRPGPRWHCCVRAVHHAVDRDLRADDGDVHGRHLRRRDRARAGHVEACARDAVADVDLPRRLGRGAVVTALASVALMFVVAVSAFGVEIRPELLPAAVVTLLLGGLTFTALGFAVSSFVRRADSAPIVANLTLFPLLFVSGVFYSSRRSPSGCGGSRTSSR